MEVAVKFRVLPSHKGPLLLAVGAVGIGFTVTFVVPAGPVHPPAVAVTEYVPLAKVVADTMLGFCNVELNPFGPVQLYVAPAITLAVRSNVDPEQIALLLPAVGATGLGEIATTVVPCGLVQVPRVATTVYVPAANAVTPVMLGLCVEAAKAFGPDQL